MLWFLLINIACSIYVFLEVRQHDKPPTDAFLWACFPFFLSIFGVLAYVIFGRPRLGIATATPARAQMSGQYGGASTPDYGPFWTLVKWMVISAAALLGVLLLTVLLAG